MTMAEREKQPARFGKYSKTIRELQESNAALVSVLGGIIERQQVEIEQLRAELGNARSAVTNGDR
jgi:hypothetical protein